MFPKDIETEGRPAVRPETAAAANREIGKSLAFDYKTDRFILVDGANKIPSKIEAIKQWIELFIRTEINRYKIYTDTFGVKLKDLVGYRLPRAYQIAEIERRITEGILRKCPNVVRVYGWRFNKGEFEFTVTTDTGEEVKIHE